MGKGFLDVFPARDISAGGVSIIVPHRFEGCAIDGDVDLVVSLPDERPHSALGNATPEAFAANLGIVASL